MRSTPTTAKPRVGPLLTLLATACGTTPPGGDDAAERAAFALVQSPPAQWATAFAAVLSCGDRAASPLRQAIAATPHGPGAQPAVAALGRLGDRSAEGLLTGLLQQRNPDLAAEAALALARLEAAGARPALRAAMMEPGNSTYVRTAAASALLDLGDRDEAVGFLCDILLAPTDGGRTRALELELPVDQARWAVERNLSIDALTRAAGGRSFELDADASWPRLTASITQVRAHFCLSTR